MYVSVLSLRVPRKEPLIIIIIIIIITTMFMVLSSWQSHCESSPGLFDECRIAPSGRRPETKPDDLGCKILAARIYTHHRHLLLLLSPKSDTHFTIQMQHMCIGCAAYWIVNPPHHGKISIGCIMSGEEIY